MKEEKILQTDWSKESLRNENNIKSIFSALNCAGKFCREMANKLQYCLYLCSVHLFVCLFVYFILFVFVSAKVVGLGFICTCVKHINV